jgi:PAS domain S-box-containing protein
MKSSATLRRRRFSAACQPSSDAHVAAVHDRSLDGSLHTAAFRDALEPMRITDRDGVILDVNEAYCRLVGQPRQSLIGRTFDCVYSRDVDHRTMLAKYRRRFEQRSVAPLLSREVSIEGGKSIYLDSTNSYITLESGETVLLTVARDNTAMRAFEEALRTSELRYRSLSESAIDGIITCDGDGRMTSWNAAAAQIFGYSASEAMGRTLLFIMPERFRAAHASALRRLQDGGAPRVIGTTVELEGLRRSGEEFPIEMSLSCWETSNGRNVSAFIRDITARTEAERQLRESETRFVRFFEHAVQGMFQSTPAGRLLRANRALIGMLGYASLDELAEKNVADLYVDPTARTALMDRLKREGACANVELQLLHKDGHPITVLEHSRTVDGPDGSILYVEGILEDITNRKELEARSLEYLDALRASRAELEETIQQKNRLISILSHDLRSPFSSILGFCEILLNENETITPSERSEYLTYIRNSAEQQLALLNRLLEWSRLDSGHLSLDLERVDLRDVVEASVTAHLGSARKNGITILSDVPAETFVRGDRNLLAQVFSNLLSNALKFTTAGGSISIERMDDMEGRWTIHVRDTGIGIPASDVSKLFKADSRYTRRGLMGEAGTGLGLSVVAESIQRHGGTIAAESEEGHGTTFIIKLPAWCEPKAQKVGCVLIVDDDAGVRALHARHVHKWRPEIDVIQAADGDDAYRLARQHRPSVVLTDYGMTGSNGYQLLCRLKDDADVSHIPVVIITGQESTASLEALRLRGAQAILSKPVTAERLRSTLEGVPGLN